MLISQGAKMEQLICPNCRSLLTGTDDSYLCKECSSEFKIENGIPVFLPSSLDKATKGEIEMWDRTDARRAGAEGPIWKIFVRKGPAILEFLDGLNYFNLEGKVLEIGGGSCWASAVVKYYYPSSEVYATDVSLSALIRAKEYARLFNVEIDKYMAIDAQSTPFPNYFDTIIGCSILHHLPSLSKGVAEIFRILKPNGVYFGQGEPMATRFVQWLARISKVKYAEEVLEYAIYED